MEEILQNEIVVGVSQSVTYVIGAFIMFFIGKLAYHLVHKKIDVKAELVDKDNFAFLPHPPILVDDFIGDQIEENEHFSKQDSIILVTLNKTDKKLVLSVSNEGESIHRKDLRKIFQSLVSIRKNKSNGSPNLGLGLYLVKLIANFHAAKVSAENLDDPIGVKINVIWDLNQKHL